MDGHVFIDRRRNPKDRSLSNRRRFVDRVREEVRHNSDSHLHKKGLRDKKDTKVTISRDTITEPRFRYDNSTGQHDYVLPGNEKFTPGDKIEKPRRSGGGGADGGEGEGFDFALSHDEYIEVIFTDLELPDMVKESEKTPIGVEWHRAGFTSSGTPASLDVERSVGRSLARRIALKNPKLSRIRALEEEAERLMLEGGAEDRLAEIEAEIARLRIAAAAVSFIDPVDLRYRRLEARPKAGAKAVMFCLMDVSGSMGDRERSIAKKFFLLLSIFLQRKYDEVELVFIRHHHNAEEVDEETFFGTGSTGGTIVSMAYEKAKQVLAERYPIADWNIYFAQASDGDNESNDGDRVKQAMEHLLKAAQYYAYIEIIRAPSYFGSSEGSTTLWKSLEPLCVKNKNLCMRKVEDEDQVISVFRSLFEANKAKAAA